MAVHEPLSTLRGAHVRADVVRIVRVVTWLLVAGLAVLVVVLVVAGARKNAQITELHRQGIPVEMTVTSCIGLLGGSGSNPAGYSCHGTFSLGGHTYDDAIPGYALLGPGTRLAGVTVPSDPGLFTTPAVLRGEQPSWRVYLAPAVLACGLFSAAAVLLVVGRRRRGRSGARSDS
jgi:hypothetical protein